MVGAPRNGRLAICHEGLYVRVSSREASFKAVLLYGRLSDALAPAMAIPNVMSINSVCICTQWSLFVLISFFCVDIAV